MNLQDFERYSRQFNKICDGDLDSSHLKAFLLNNQAILRFKHAHPHQDQAFVAWRKALIWRVQNKLSLITLHSIKNSLKSGKAFWHGFDKQGNPILVVRIRFHNPRHCDNTQKIRHAVWLMDRGCQLADKSSGKLSVIWDVSDFKKRQSLDYSSLGLLKQFATIFQQYYPERLAYFLFLKASWIFRSATKVLSLFLSEKTACKIIHLSDTAQLQKYVDPANLLIQHGGQSNFQYQFNEPNDQISQIVKVSSKIPNYQSYEEVASRKQGAEHSTADLKN